MKDLSIESLKEIFNIGAGGAANALSKIIKKRVLIDIPKLTIISPDEVIDELGPPDKRVGAVYFDINGGFNGGIVIIFELDAIMKLASIALKNFDRDINSDKTISFIKEISNIMSSYFLNNFSKFIKKVLIPSTPSYAMDMMGAMLEELFANYNKEGTDIMFLETLIFNEEEKISFDFLLIPDTKSSKMLIQKV